MARCDDIARAETVFEIYKRIAPDLNPILVHSEEGDSEDRLDDLRSGKSYVVVCVNMLGEGFDLPQLKVECSVCGEAVHPHATVRLVCSDVYCKPCLKSFFLRVAKDESLFPPTCHRQAIDISTIEADFSVEELTAYRSAELEFSSTDRVYCANPECAKFIPMPQRALDCASCEACSAGTCMHCKALAHKGGCPADEARQSLINFADEQGWKPCFGCGEMVFRYEGCDHMT